MCSNLQRLSRKMKKKPTRDFFFFFFCQALQIRAQMAFLISVKTDLNECRYQ